MLVTMHTTNDTAIENSEESAADIAATLIFWDHNTVYIAQSAH